MNKVTVSDSIKYIGADDREIDLFESQYIVPNGVSYNSYLILDEQVAVMDTVDARVEEIWFSNLERELDGRMPDYLVVSHMEPDHGSLVAAFAEKYPQAKIVGNAKTFDFIRQFLGWEVPGERRVVVAENDSISLGEHTLTFVMAPMVHWPEVMVAYESKEKVLFSADGFGKFGALDTEEDWTCEARRYYFNIVGKYGPQVQALLKKAAALDIQMICPLHGPILKTDLGYYLDIYDTWSSYRPESEGVLVAYASVHGGTGKAAQEMAEQLKKAGCPKVAVTDLCRDDLAEALEDAFRYDTMVLACVTYNNELLTQMDTFLHMLKGKAYQKRRVALIENGSWVPNAAKNMKAVLETMKEIELVEPIITIRSSMTQENQEQIAALAEQLCERYR